MKQLRAGRLSGAGGRGARRAPQAWDGRTRKEEEGKSGRRRRGFRAAKLGVNYQMLGKGARTRR